MVPRWKLLAARYPCKREVYFLRMTMARAGLVEEEFAREFNAHFARQVAAAVAASGYSAATIARASGLRAREVTEIIAGRPRSIRSIVALAALCGLRLRVSFEPHWREVTDLKALGRYEGDGLPHDVHQQAWERYTERQREMGREITEERKDAARKRWRTTGRRKSAA